MQKIWIYILVIILIAVLCQLFQVSSLVEWYALRDAFSQIVTIAIESNAFQKIDKVAMAVFVFGIGCPFLIAALWNWLSKGTKSKPTINDNMRVWTALFVLLTALSCMTLTFAILLFNSLGCYNSEGCSSFDAMNVSVTAIEITLILTAFGGFWMFRKLTKDEATKVAEKYALDYIMKNISSYVTPKLVSEAIQEDGPLISTILGAIKNNQPVQDDFAEDDAEIAEPTGQEEIS